MRTNTGSLIEPCSGTKAGVFGSRPPDDPKPLSRFAEREQEPILGISIFKNPQACGLEMS